MPRPTKLTPELIREIKRRRREGATFQDIADELAPSMPDGKLSVGSVAGACRLGVDDEEGPPAPEDADPPELGVTDEDSELSPDDIAVLLGKHVRDLQKEIARARTTKNEPAYQRAVSNLTKALQMLTKAQSKKTDVPKGTWVSAPEMLRASERCRNALHAGIDKALEKRKPGAA